MVVAAAVGTKVDTLVASIANEASEVVETNSVGTGLGAGSSRYLILDITEVGRVGGYFLKNYIADQYRHYWVNEHTI